MGYELVTELLPFFAQSCHITKCRKVHKLLLFRCFRSCLPFLLSLSLFYELSPYEETQHSLPTAEYHSLLILKNKQRKRNVYVLHFIFSVFLLFSPGFCLLFTRMLSFYLSVIINYLSVIILYLSRDKTLSRLDNIETHVFCKYKIGT